MRIVNRLKAFVLALALLLGCAALAAAALKPFILSEPRTAEDLRLMPASAWNVGQSGQSDMLLKLSYLRGMIDALAYTHLAPAASASVLPRLQGMSLGEVIDAVDAYYREDEAHAKLPPAAVFMRVLPENREKTKALGQSALEARPPEGSWVGEGQAAPER